jgi:sporulation protein YlmC with PRC-barrel domain
MNKISKFNLMVITGALCLATSGQIALQAQDAAQPAVPQTTATNAACTKMNKCSNLIGSTVQNAQGEKLGKISDIVLDLNNGRVSYCVLEVSHKISATTKCLAVPIGAFQCSADETCLILNAEKEKVAQAQGIDHNDWPPATNPAWGAQPFWQDPPKPSAPSSHGLPRPSSQQ